MGLLLLAGVLGGGAVWVLLGPAPAERRLRLLAASSGPGAAVRVARWMGALYASVRARREDPAVWRRAVIELCDGIAAELSAGRAPEAALAGALAVLDPRVAGAILDGLHGPAGPEGWPGDEGARDVDAVLARVAVRPGAEGLRLLAASWRIGAERGGTFATVVEGLAAALRDEEAQREEIAAQLAGPRATARLLAVLPLVGLAMAAALGARPLAFLFGTIPGAVCLLLGIGLDVAGLWWTHRLADAAQVRR